MRLFFDSSAFVKRYVMEPGSDRVLDLASRADALGVSVLVLPEVVSTLCRLVRERRLGKQQFAVLKPAVLRDLSDADVCDLTPSALEHALLCLERHSLRALDALHVGCAHAYGPDLFVSADRRQCEVAKREGLAVEYLSP